MPLAIHTGVSYQKGFSRSTHTLAFWRVCSRNFMGDGYSRFAPARSSGRSRLKNNKAPPFRSSSPGHHVVKAIAIESGERSGRRWLPRPDIEVVPPGDDWRDVQVF